MTARAIARMTGENSAGSHRSPEVIDNGIGVKDSFHSCVKQCHAQLAAVLASNPLVPGTLKLVVRVE